jgi:hypothetical protein
MLYNEMRHSAEWRFSFNDCRRVTAGIEWLRFKRRRRFGGARNAMTDTSRSAGIVQSASTVLKTGASKRG